MAANFVESVVVGILVAASIAWLAWLVLSHPTIRRLREPDAEAGACGSCPSGSGCSSHTPRASAR